MTVSLANLYFDRSILAARRSTPRHWQQKHSETLTRWTWLLAQRATMWSRCCSSPLLMWIAILCRLGRDRRSSLELLPMLYLLYGFLEWILCFDKPLLRKVWRKVFACTFHCKTSRRAPAWDWQLFLNSSTELSLLHKLSCIISINASNRLHLSRWQPQRQGCNYFLLLHHFLQTISHNPLPNETLSSSPSIQAA